MSKRFITQQLEPDEKPRVIAVVWVCDGCDSLTSDMREFVRQPDSTMLCEECLAKYGNR